MLGTELIGWFAEVLGKRPDGVQVQPDRGRRIMPDLEVLQHPLSKWCHSKNSFRCDHITNRLPAEPPTPWNLRDSALHLPEGLCSMLHIGPISRVSPFGFNQPVAVVHKVRRALLLAFLWKDGRPSGHIQRTTTGNVPDLFSELSFSPVTAFVWHPLPLRAFSSCLCFGYASVLQFPTPRMWRAMP